MMATRASALPAGDQWSYEVKWDGYRAQGIKNGRTVSLASRNLKDITRQFPTITAAVSRIRADSAIVDGETVAADTEGRPSFQALHHWSLDGVSLVYYAFDLLHLDGRDLTRRPLDERRAALRHAIDGSGLLLSDVLPGTPQQITDAIRELGLEGIIAKKRRSTYAAGRRSDAWIKVRFARHQELVVGGYKPTAASFDSLLVGYYDGRKLMYAGKVRNGFTPAARAQVFAAMRPLELSRCPFVNLPSTRGGHWGEGVTAEEMPVIRWVKPAIVAEVSFAEWTRDGSLRHAAFVGLRDDKRPRDVHRE